jgi:mannose-6-phosphate isomerase
MQPLRGQIRDYAWGSRTVLARLQGRPAPSPGPEAELWFGAHPSAPARLPDGSLLDAIAAGPAAVLGAGTVARFGARLPYLLKVLAAEEPLSIQAHPDATRARAAYDAGHPSYADRYHKPELLVAVEEFDALCGFRDPEESADRLESLAVDALKPVVAALRTGTVAERLRQAMAMLMHWPGAERRDLVSALRLSRDPLAASLAERYPDDLGVAVALLLNRVRLAPDEAVWMPAGNLHAYLRGTGVEIMAASDNVLRGGLTPKRVDVPELLRVLRFEVLADPVVRPVPAGPGLVTWPVPVPDFVLHKAVLAGDPVTLPGDGPRIVLCLAGPVEVRSGDRTLSLTPAAAAFVPAGEPPVTASGMGEIFQAGVIG